MSSRILLNRYAFVFWRTPAGLRICAFAVIMIPAEIRTTSSAIERRDTGASSRRILKLMATDQNTAHDLDYKGYLNLSKLLELQRPLASPPCHDEMLFIIIHQVFELWFRLMIHEVDQVLALLKAGDALESERLIRRLTSIVRLFIPKLSVLETMIPSDFIQFRDLLKPASGFQSVQFREVEFASGLKEPRYLGMFRSDPDATARLNNRLNEPTLWDAFIKVLEERGFGVHDESSQIRAIVTIYRGGSNHDLRMLCEAMIE